VKSTLIEPSSSLGVIAVTGIFSPFSFFLISTSTFSSSFGSFAGRMLKYVGESCLTTSDTAGPSITSLSLFIEKGDPLTYFHQQ